MAVRAGVVERLPMSWADYNELGDEVPGEYIDGALLMVPTPDRHHQAAILHLVSRLSTVCRPGEEVTTGWGWSPVGVSEEYVPDVMVFPATNDQIRFGGIPLLCVEITSGDRGTDLVVKRAKYAAAGLRDYWVVDRLEPALIQYEVDGDLLVETGRRVGSGVITVSFSGRSVELDLDLLLPRKR